MDLQYVFDQLAYGELSQVFNGSTPQNQEPDQQRVIVHHVQAALTALHSRFLLKEESLKVVPVDGRLIYPITLAHAESNTASTETDKFIKDLEDPFLDDLLKIERVYDQDERELVLNDLGNSEALRTPNYQTLVLPDTHTHTALTLAYRANHRSILVEARTYPLYDVDIALPEQYLNALMLFVASRMLNPNGPSTEGFHEGNNYYSRYEAECRLLQNQNYEIDSLNTHTRFQQRGFV